MMGAHCLFRLGTSSKRRRVGSLSPTLSSPTTLSSMSTLSSNWSPAIVQRRSLAAIG
ncbi:hypothetical protein CFP56_040318 [Quercus suber]|uniref:Uncharacterized protein n=1 Tax=Quercus suber TaxID=58331 RepID=A0AAW0LKS7_QUESU